MSEGPNSGARRGGGRALLAALFGHWRSAISPAGSRLAALASSASRAWRRTLTRILSRLPTSRMSSGLTRTLEPLRAALAHLRDPGSAQVRVGSLRLAGATALVIGLAPASVYALWRGDVAARLVAIGWACAWAALRYVVMLGATRPEIRDDIHRAWAGSLLPYLIWSVPIAGPPAAWLLSGVLARMSLKRSGVPPGAADRAVLLAWGAQAAFSVMRWVGGNALYLALWLRR